jgi:hypothetical protein
MYMDRPTASAATIARKSGHDITFTSVASMCSSTMAVTHEGQNSTRCNATINHGTKIMHLSTRM